MGSIIELNDILQITAEQGFPSILKLEQHTHNPFTAENFKNQIFKFKDKSKIRLFQQSPIRVFFVQNINDKWIFWGHIEIIEITHNLINKTTSGKFIITKIFTPEQMIQADEILNPYPEKSYFTHPK